MATFTTKPLTVNSPKESRSNVTLRFGVIGYGYWGPNVARNL
jgi:hypothetical protein